MVVRANCSFSGAVEELVVYWGIKEIAIVEARLTNPMARMKTVINLVVIV